MNSYRWKFPLIAVIVAGFVAAWAAFGITYGIDLQGGTVQIYDLRGKKTIDEDLVKSTITILQKRLDTLGMKEMSIRPAGNGQVVIQLPGASKEASERIKEIIRRSGQMSFKIVVDEDRADPTTIHDIEDQKARGDYDPSANDFDTCSFKPKGGGPGRPMLVQNEGAVDGKYLEGADATFDSWGGPAVRFYMKPEGRMILANTTEKYQKKRMAIILDGECESAPVINTPITEGTGIIEGQFTPEERDDLITVLRSGALPAKPVLASENTIEPTLGLQERQRGTLATLFAVLIVVLFMFIYYHGAGAIANIALVCNILILVGFMALFEATLTLPGIAGIVLTIGMAVDANILIYERMREEKRRGLPVEEYIDAGYAHAFWAIFDTHVTTFGSAFILNLVGTGPIKGFAVTLMIGVAISFFTALFVTRAIYDFLLDTGRITNVSMIELRKEVTKIPFLKKRQPFVIASVLLFNIGYLAFVVRGDEKYGIDFNGGSLIQARFTTALKKSDIVERLAKIEKRSASGAVEHPYEDAEVGLLGAPDDPKTGAGRYFQVLISGSGASAKKVAMAGGDGVAHADTKPGAAGTSAAATTATTTADAAGAVGASEAPQDAFMRDFEAAFAAELAPPAFSERKVEADATVQGKARVSFDVHLAPGKAIDPDAAKRALADAGEPDVQVTAVTTTAVPSLHVVSGLTGFEPNELEHTETRLKSVLESKFTNDISNPFPYKTSVGSSVAESLKYRAILAIVLMLIGVVVYLAFRFEFKMGLAAALCLFHDVLVVVGFMMLLDVTSKWTGIDAKQSLLTISAYLTIIGYSINDTIVTFDRMRENLAKWDPKTNIAIGHNGEKLSETYEDVLNRSINETLGRTILTSLTVFLTLIVLALSGVKSLEAFVLAMLVGIVFGTYSSIVIATPILLVKPRKLLYICGIELAYFVVAAIVGGHLKL